MGNKRGRPRKRGGLSAYTAQPKPVEKAVEPQPEVVPEEPVVVPVVVPPVPVKPVVAEEEEWIGPHLGDEYICIAEDGCFFADTLYPYGAVLLARDHQKLPRHFIPKESKEAQEHEDKLRLLREQIKREEEAADIARFSSI